MFGVSKYQVGVRLDVDAENYCMNYRQRACTARGKGGSVFCFAAKLCNLNPKRVWRVAGSPHSMRFRD